MIGETERMNTYKRQLLCIGLGIVIALLRTVLSAFPSMIDTYYSKGINKWWKLKNLNYIVGLKVGKVLLNTERKDIR